MRFDFDAITEADEASPCPSCGTTRLRTNGAPRCYNAPCPDARRAAVRQQLIDVPDASICDLRRTAIHDDTPPADS